MSGFEKGNEELYASMLAVEDDPSRFYSLFTLMAKFDDGKKRWGNLSRRSRNLRYYSKKELRSLASVLIDA